MMSDREPGFCFEVTRRVEFYETDAAGIVHFSNFFRYMETAEHAFLRSLGHQFHEQHGEAEIGWASNNRFVVHDLDGTPVWATEVRDGTCSDGEDNDGDGWTDLDDSGCVDLSDLATLLANYGFGT